MLQRRLLSFSDCSICLKIFNTFNIDWLHYSESSWRPLIAGLGPGGGSGHGVPDLALLMMLSQLVQVSQLMLCCCYCCCYKLSFFSDCCSICLVTSSEVYWCSKTEKRKKNNLAIWSWPWSFEILLWDSQEIQIYTFNWFHHCHCTINKSDFVSYLLRCKLQKWQLGFAASEPSEIKIILIFWILLMLRAW